VESKTIESCFGKLLFTIFKVKRGCPGFDAPPQVLRVGSVAIGGAGSRPGGRAEEGRDVRPAIISACWVLSRTGRGRGPRTTTPSETATAASPAIPSGPIRSPSTTTATTDAVAGSASTRVDTADAGKCRSPTPKRW
jgi:hypothetical protein